MDMELTDSAPPDAPDEHTKPHMAWGSQTSRHRVSEIDFVNEVTNERKSIIPQAWIHHPRVSSRNICKCRIASIITLIGLKTATARNLFRCQNLSINNTPCIKTGRHTENMPYRHGQPDLTHMRCGGKDPAKHHIKMKRYSQKPNIFSCNLISFPRIAIVRFQRLRVQLIFQGFEQLVWIFQKILI